MIPGQYWGVTQAERALRLDCDRDELGNTAICERAMSVAAPVDIVFAWFCQLRTAPYSYDWLDNWGRRSPRERDPAPPVLAPGQRVMSSFYLVRWRDNEYLTLSASGFRVTYAVRPDAGGSRIHVRTRVKRGPFPAFLLAPLMLGDLLMMRKQLRLLKELAEREAGDS